MPESAQSAVQLIAIWALPVLFAITLHEVAHGWVARAFGDDTAARLGRLSLNPVRHVDPVGTIVVPIVLLLLGGFIFGWAKPVPVVMRNMRRPRRDMAIVAAAGPLANLAMALAWGLLLKIALWQGADHGIWLGVRYMAVAGILINCVLMVLNLLPLPPLDGSRVVNGLLPEGAARVVDRIEPYGLLLLVLLMASGILGSILGPPLRVVEGVLYRLLDINPLALL
jgi:Zn-dependent protease